jgi:membrane protein DedA with SNARE-associated domain
MKKIADFIMKFFIILTVGLWILTLIKPELIKNFIEWIKIIIENLWYWNYLIIFLSSLIESLPVIWVVVPGQNILMLVWWFFAKISISNFIYVMIISSLWAIISNFIGYYLWKIYWKTFFKEYWLWFWIWETEVKYMEKWIKKWWAWGIIIWKFHNLARAFIPFIAWSMWMQAKTFWIYNIIGSIIRAITIVILWVFFAEHYETIIDYFWYITMWIIFLVWIYIYKYKKKEFMKYMQEKNDEIERKLEGKK